MTAATSRAATGGNTAKLDLSANPPFYFLCLDSSFLSQANMNYDWDDD